MYYNYAELKPNLLSVDYLKLKYKLGFFLILIFIDSYIDDTIYKNRKVIHYRKIHDDFDLIIISSFLYEKEMIDNLRNINKDVSIYRFYKNIRNDIFSDYKIFLQYLAMEK